MPDWDSADCLKRFKDEAGLEDASELDDDDDIYPLLSDAQEEVFRMIASRYPSCLYVGPELMVPDADRKTFKYAPVNGQDVMMMGWVQIAPRLNSFFSDERFVGWEVDLQYLDEGTRIRIPGDRSWSGNLYARGVPRPPRITDVVPPSLRPVEFNVLTINRAVRKWAKQGNQRPDIAKAMDEEFGYPVTTGPRMFAEIMLTIKRRHRTSGALIDPAQWYLSSPDLGSAT